MNPRIIAGSAKNQKLAVFDGFTRPVTDRIKQSIFDLINDRIPGADILDLYAGSGSFGIEALSRGAKHATFVELEREVQEMLKQNLVKTKLLDQASIVSQDAAKFMKKSKQAYDIVFADPPFAIAAEFPGFLLLRVMHDKSIAMVRMPVKTELKIPKSLQIIHSQEYGQSTVNFITKALPSN